MTSTRAIGVTELLNIIIPWGYSCGRSRQRNAVNCQVGDYVVTVTIHYGAEEGLAMPHYFAVGWRHRNPQIARKVKETGVYVYSLDELKDTLAHIKYDSSKTLGIYIQEGLWN